MIEATCPMCRMIYHLGNEMDGKTGKCTVCETRFPIPPPMVWDDLGQMDASPEFQPAEISRSNPLCLIFLIDQSSSMEEAFGDSGTRQECVAETLNRFLYSLTMSCTKEDGIRDYFYAAVYGYGGESRVADLLEGLRPISWFAYNTKAIESRRRKQVDESGNETEVEFDFPVWISPAADGKTPMAAAFQIAREIVVEWVNHYPDAFPPIVVNITDGAYTDENPTGIAREIMLAKTRVGNALVMNCHISGAKESTLFFPNNETMRQEDGLQRLLYQMSSVLPQSMLSQARRAGHAISEGARAFAYNADMVDLVGFLNLGTLPAGEVELIPEK